MSKFVRIPKRGDIAANELKADELGNHKTVYIPYEQYKAADIAGTHEVLGVVAGIIGNEALIVHPDCGTTKKFTDRLWWYCSGYTLDGSLHTITFSLCFASNSWNSTTKTIKYSATTLSGLISVLNTAFAADSDFTAQEWYADEYSGNLRLTCENLNINQVYNNSASGGLTMGTSMPELVPCFNMLRKNGNFGTWGAIASMQRALKYYINDNGVEDYNGGRRFEQTSVKQSFPINLPTWLGISTKNPGDFCAPLRAIYGEGEEGWKRFMYSCLTVTPTDIGSMGIHDGKSICNTIAQITGRKMSIVDVVPLMKPFNKAYNLMGNTFSNGDFWVPTTEEIFLILNGNLDSSDPLNIGLTAISGDTVNNSRLCSCNRYDSSYVWTNNTTFGLFDVFYVKDSYKVIPVSRSII